MIRNFSGAMDAFCLFSRALTDDEIHALHGMPKANCSLSQWLTTEQSSR